MDRKDDFSGAELAINADEYSIMEQLEILETVREDMEDLGVSTLAEVIQRIEVLHRQLDSKEKA
ncbi:MAG: hypothetical protein ABI456_22775 [Ktedonobacteraceae bacterium]|nr:hypothetical protein [Chloroflexota bacterium]